MEYESSVAKFPVTIKQQTVPKLYDPGPERKIRNLVTIATKTFLRPHKLKILLQSIRKYYPDITVIVADDSKEPLEINDELRGVLHHALWEGLVCWEEPGHLTGDY